MFNTTKEANKTKNIKIVILVEVLREFSGVKMTRCLHDVQLLKRE